MRNPFLISIAAFCLVFAAGCDNDGGGNGGAGSGGSGGSGGSAGSAGTGGSAGSAGTGGSAGSAGTGGSAGGGGSGGTGGSAGPPTFDLSQSVFVAYNSLLDEVPGCDNPDLNAGNLQCVKVLPPDINGTITLTNTSGNNWDVDVSQTLNSVINADLAGLNASVLITATSLTVLNGTGTGSVPGTITLTEFTDAVGTQNMIVDATAPGAGGTAQCLALNNLAVGDPCFCADPTVPCAPDFNSTPPRQNCVNSALGQTCGNLVAGECDPVDVSGPLANPLAICNLAGLPITSCTAQWPGNGLALEDSGCFYDLPTPDDNLARFFSSINVAGNVAQLGGGPTQVSGYYRANAYDPTAGPQWIALSGVQQ